MRRALFVSFALAVMVAALSSVAWAATDNSLDLSMVGVPILAKGRLVNYVLVKVSLTLRPGVDVSHLSEKEPYFREALARLGYRTPLNPPTSLNRVDPELVRVKLLPLCQTIAGPGVVTGVEVKFQEPQKRVEEPAPAAASPPRP
jgi:hypothetical protein